MTEGLHVIEVQKDFNASLVGTLMIDGVTPADPPVLNTLLTARVIL